MKIAKIYNLAMNQLLLKWERESKNLEKNPESEICKYWVEEVEKEINELHELILEEEKK